MARNNDFSNKDPRSALAEQLKLRATARAEYLALLDQRGTELMSVAEKTGPLSEKYTQDSNRLSKAQGEFDRIHSALRRPIAVMHAPLWLLFGGAFCLAVLEASVNKFLFDVALQSAGAVSYMASTAMTAFILFTAHFAGANLRQCWSQMRRLPELNHILVFGVCTAFAFGGVGLLTVARAAFASETGTIADLASAVTGQIADMGIWGALLFALKDMHALILGSMNVGGIVATFLLAFFYHDPDHDFDHAYRSQVRLEKQIRRLHDNYLVDRERTIKDVAPHLIGYASNYNLANGRVIELKSLLGLAQDDDDRLVITDLDRLAEDSLHADETGAPPDSGQANVHDLREYRRPNAQDSL